MNFPVYDNPNAIAATLGNLRAFDALIRARREAGYQRQESLHEYVVEGRWVLDACGNCLVIEGDAEVPLKPVGAVLTRAEFWAQQPEGASLSAVFRTPYVLPGATCACCGLAWSWPDVHDFEQEHASRDVPAARFAGWRTDAAFRTIEQRTDGHWRRSQEYSLRRGIVHNDQGYIGIESLPILTGDEVLSFSVWTFRHVACFRFELTQRAYRTVRDACPYRAKIKEVPNQYSSHRRYPPWFEVTHPDLLPLTIGRRKRVWTINYPGADRFPDWPHTHGDGFVHVYTEEEMRKVVRQLKVEPA